MYWGDSWETVDGEKLWSLFNITQVVLNPKNKLACHIVDKYETYGFDIYYHHEFYTRCSYGGVVDTNSDNAISSKAPSGKLCETCRGKGYSWKCKILNGKPYFAKMKTMTDCRTKKTCSFVDTSGIDWKNPDYCEDCNGKGTI